MSSKGDKGRPEECGPNRIVSGKDVPGFLPEAEGVPGDTRFQLAMPCPEGEIERTGEVGFGSCPAAGYIG